uniref:Uncharacterized protein n=1 Tax=Glossina pallidipes TaxID=7398 RepID=A0A1A9Z742_GLOPL
MQTTMQQETYAAAVQHNINNNNTTTTTTTTTTIKTQLHAGSQSFNDDKCRQLDVVSIFVVGVTDFEFVAVVVVVVATEHSHCWLNQKCQRTPPPLPLVSPYTETTTINNNLSIKCKHITQFVGLKRFVKCPLMIHKNNCNNSGISSNSNNKQSLSKNNLTSIVVQLFRIRLKTASQSVQDATVIDMDISTV